MKSTLNASWGLASKIVLILTLLLIQLTAMDLVMYQSGHAGLSDTVQADMADPWYDDSWRYRKEIAIDHTQVEGESFADYPLLFSATDATLKDAGNGGKVGQASGGDILFTLGDGTTKLAHEVERYDAATGELSAWVKIPTLSQVADTKLYIYYGNVNASDQADADSVWGSGYRMVQHMDGSTSLEDSTTNGNDGTKSGAILPQEVPGKVGQAQSFSENGSITIGDNDSLDLDNGDWTISFWLKSDNGNGGDIFSKGHVGNGIDIKKTEGDQVWGLQDSLENLNFNMPRYLWSDGSYLYITDSGNHRIVKRRVADLSYVSSFGTYGTGNDQFDGPRGIWGDSTFLYIADANNDRIVKRRLDDMSFVASVGTYGAGNDQFDTPTGVWGDGTYLYVADTNNSRIVKRLASDLSFVAAAGSYGTTTSLFNSPRGIYCDGTYLYIADTNNNRVIKRLASTLAYVSYIGGTASGTGDNQFNRPWGLWGDGVNIFVADTNNNRIVKRLASTLAYVSKSGAIFNYQEGLWGDGTYLYVADTNNNRIGKYLAADYSPVAQLQKSGSGAEQFTSPQGVWVSGDYLYTVDTGNHRVVKRRKSDLSFVASYGSLGTGNDQFNGPQRMWGDETHLFITDTVNNRVVKRLASDFSFVSSIGTTGSGIDQFNQPVGIWGDATYLYVCDVTNSRIVKRLKSDLSYVASVGAFGTGDEQFHAPRDLWSDGTYLYIADTNNNRIVKRLASDLSLVSTFGTNGVENDQFRNPYGIWGDGEYLYLLDTYNQRLMKRNLADMSYVSSVGSLGSGADQFNYAKGLRGDGAYLYIADSDNHRIMKRLKSDLGLVSELNSASVSAYSTPLGASYEKIAIVKSHPDHQPFVITIYKNGVLDASGSSTTSDDFFNNAEALSLGSALTGEIDELRLFSGAQNANLIRTEYNNQSAPQTFAFIAAEEAYMDHLTITGSSTQTAGQAQDTTITAIDTLGAVKTAFAGDKSVTLSGANPAGAFAATFTDKNGNEIGFGSAGTLVFTNGVAVTTIRLYKAETAEIEVVSGPYDSAGDAAYGLDVAVEPAGLGTLEIITLPNVTSETAFSLTINARDAYANITTSLSEAVALGVNLGNLDVASVASAEFTDDGTYSANVTLSEIYQDASVVLTARSGLVEGTRNIAVTGVARPGAFLAPAKPAITLSDIEANNIPENIEWIAVSSSVSFENAAWEALDREKLPSLLASRETWYLKFRTDQGGVSDVFTVDPDVAAVASVKDGDIIQCRNSGDPDAVYIVKIVGEKKFIRHIVSLEIFNYYAHLKWENLIQVESLDGFSLSGWVRVNTGAGGQPGPSDRVYEINGDQTRHWIDMTASEFLQHGGSEEAIYSINQGELNLYREGAAVKLM